MRRFWERLNRKISKKKQNQKNAWAKAGFTLIEILIVVGIIAAFLAWIMSRVFDMSGRATTKQVEISVNAILAQAALYSQDCRGFPESIDDLLTDPGDACPRWDGPYIKESDAVDPWGQDFIIEDGEDGYPRIVSYGADKRPGGTGKGKDIYSEPMM